MKKILALVLIVLAAPLAALAHMPKSAEIVMVVDRSGSMADKLRDAEGGLNAFIDEQKRLGGDAKLTLVQFDTDYETVHARTPIEQVGHYRLEPRGNTALLDAIGRALNESEGSTADVRVLVIVTDGLENASHEQTLAGIRERLEARQKAGWKIAYIGAGIEDFAGEARSLGIDPGFYVDGDTVTILTSATSVSALVTDARSGVEFESVTDDNITAESFCNAELDASDPRSCAYQEPTPP